jgi:hypothetical protein
LAGDRLGYFLFGAFDPNGGRPLNAAGVTFRTEANWTSDGGANYSLPAYVSFETSDVPIPPATGSVRTEKVRITGSGNVGVGTTAPKQKIEINGGVRLNTTNAKPSCDANARGTLWFTQGSGTADLLEVCGLAADGVSYSWKQLMTW